MYMYLHLCDKETLMTTKSFVGCVYLWKGGGYVVLYLKNYLHMNLLPF